MSWMPNFIHSYLQRKIIANNSSYFIKIMCLSLIATSFQYFENPFTYTTLYSFKIFNSLSLSAYSAVWCKVYLDDCLKSEPWVPAVLPNNCMDLRILSSLGSKYLTCKRRYWSRLSCSTYRFLQKIKLSCIFMYDIIVFIFLSGV